MTRRTSQYLDRQMQTRWAHDLHFLELGGPREELLVGVFVTQDPALRVDLLRLLLVAPVHLQLVLPVPVPPVNQPINQSISRLIIN